MPRRMARALSQRLGPDEGEKGISLVELLVSMMIFAIILTLVGSMYSSMSRTVSLGNSINQSSKLASSALNEAARVIRFATTNAVLNQSVDSPAFVMADNEALTIYSYVDASAAAPQPLKVAFTVNGSRSLVETRYVATLNSGYWVFGSATTSTVITGALASPSVGQPALFAYQLLDGTTLAVPTGGLAASQFASIAAVQVTIRLKGDTSTNSQPVVLQNTVGIPNLGLNRTGQ